MIKTQIAFPEHELAQLQRAAMKSGKSVAELVREAVRRTWLQMPTNNLIASWHGPARPAIDHDSIYDER